MSNTNDLMARLARLEADVAAKDAKIAELAAKSAKSLDYAQLNGHLTFPKGTRRDCIGKKFTVTLVISGQFGTSKQDNVSARLTDKVRVSDIKIEGDAPEAAPAQ